MRKFIYFSVALCMLLCATFTSCESCTTTNSNYIEKIQYSLTADGQADGILEVSFPQGCFELNGEADLLFKLASDSAKFLTKSSKDLEKALTSDNAEESTAAFKVENYLDKIQLNSIDGTYYIRLTGYAKEPVTGLVFAIDKTFTNRPVDEK